MVRDDKIRRNVSATNYGVIDCFDARLSRVFYKSRDYLALARCAIYQVAPAADERAKILDYNKHFPMIDILDILDIYRHCRIAHRLGEIETFPRRRSRESGAHFSN